MIEPQQLQELAEHLAESSGPRPPAVYDARIDAARLGAHPDPALLEHIKHQALLRCYQARYVVLPSEPPTGSLVERLGRHYGAERMQRLTDLRPQLEAELIEPWLGKIPAAAGAEDCAAYLARVLPPLDIARNEFLEALARNERREHHYRGFLVQSSADLLAEASAAALGVIGEFGPPQSALFRILIDEFGYGSHRQKHSVLYRATLRSFGLCDEYNFYWNAFDTHTLLLHNAIHFLFQNPGRLFLQIGFLVYAEAAYRRSTELHQRYLSEFHPTADARYFAEHAHIDRHHTRMVVDEVITPLVARYGAEVGHEIVRGAELTRSVFERFGRHALGLLRAFEHAGHPEYGFVTHDDGAAGELVTPASASAWPAAARVQVSAIGSIAAAAFGEFPEGCIGRVQARSA